MLFWLEGSLADAIEDPEKSDLVSMAVDKIIYSQIYGNHIYFSDPRTLERLIRSERLDKRTRGHLIGVYNKSSQKGIYRDFKIFAEVSWGRNFRQIVNREGKLVIKISADVVINSSITEKTILLCENNRDIELFKIITKVYMWETKYHYGLAIRYDGQNGGGNNIGAQYDYLQKENQRLCLCIVDPDWDYKGDGLGDTANNLVHIHDSNIANGINNPFCCYMFIPTREAENLLPSQALRAITNGNPQRQEFVTWFDQLEQRTNDARFFVDIKEGMHFQRVINKGNQMCIQYWSAILQSWLPNCTYISDKYCENDCDCLNVPGMGGHTLENALTHLERFTSQKLDEMLKGNKQLSKNWFYVGENIFFWLVSTPQFSVY